MGLQLDKQDRQGKINIWNPKSDEKWSSKTIASFAVRYHKVSSVSNIILQTVLLCTTPKPNGKFCMGVKGMERLDCIVVLTKVASQSVVWQFTFILY